MTDSLKIRDFSIDDYDAVVNLWQISSLPYRPEGRDARDVIETELKGGQALFRVAELENNIVSAIFGTHDGRKGWINRLVVDPEYRRRGIAVKMIEDVEQLLDSMGIQIVACLIEDWNTESSAFFTRIGYFEHDDIKYFSKRKNQKS